MGEQGRVGDVEALIREILRYLNYLDALRRPPDPPAAGAGRKTAVTTPRR